MKSERLVVHPENKDPDRDVTHLISMYSTEHITEEEVALKTCKKVLQGLPCRLFVLFFKPGFQAMSLWIRPTCTHAAAAELFKHKPDSSNQS